MKKYGYAEEQTLKAPPKAGKIQSDLSSNRSRLCLQTVSDELQSPAKSPGTKLPWKTPVLVASSASLNIDPVIAMETGCFGVSSAKDVWGVIIPFTKTVTC